LLDNETPFFARRGLIMRIKKEKMNVSYRETKLFFEKRARKFQMDNPYSVTMYQDNHPDLVKERNWKEVQKLLPLLKLKEDTRVLDVACGIGRWADALPDFIEEYCGVDFSEELIDIAAKRNKKENFSFYIGAANEIEHVLEANGKNRYNRILMIGIFLYLNDSDIIQTLEQVERVCEEHAIICIREPIGISERLTLKDFFSEELDDYYNAIYRTRNELKDFLKRALLDKGFRIVEENFLFEEDKLNNRKETAQYYYILER